MATRNRKPRGSAAPSTAAAAAPAKPGAAQREASIADSPATFEPVPLPRRPGWLLLASGMLLAWIAALAWLAMGTGRLTKPPRNQPPVAEQPHG